MSHEIRTPLNGILGYGQVLASTLKDPVTRNYALTIIRGAHSLMTLLNDILDLSKVEAGKLTVNPVDSDLLRLIQGIVDAAAVKAYEKGIEILIEEDSPVPKVLKIDGQRLGQVLTNLIGNAIKFTNKGQVIIRLYAPRVNDTETLLAFSVVDSGVGIALDAQRNIFQPFVQADQSINRNFGGTGLGLAISKQLVELMGGGIVLSESRPGLGSTFSFTIPAPCSIENVIDPVLPPNTKIIIVEPHDRAAESVRKAIDEESCPIIHAATTDALLHTLGIFSGVAISYRDRLDYLY